MKKKPLKKPKRNGFKLLKPIKGSRACLTCGCGSHDEMNMKRILGVGFGDCTLMKDGQLIWSEMNVIHAAKARGEEPKLLLGEEAEKMAAKDPNHDWRVHFFAPLYEAEYQRQGEGHWPLVKKGLGFA